MRSILFFMTALLWALPLMAETYSWVDGQGTVNFTDDYSQIPRKYRNKVNKREDVAPSPTVQVPKTENSGAANAAPKEGDTKRPGATATASPEQVFGEKKASEWQREFRERDAELERLDAKVKELAEIRKKAQVSGPEQVDLYKQHRAALETYNESIKRFNELNDAANQAGVPAEFRK